MKSKLHISVKSQIKLGKCWVLILLKKYDPIKDYFMSLLNGIKKLIISLQLANTVKSAET